MYKLCKKLTASILCLSFFSLQMSLAGSFDGTEVLPGVGGGAGADIEQATDGLTGITGAGSNNATLEFGKDTVIDWGHFNVGNGQTLTFNNGSFAVLNNVLHGMSTIAGQITGGQGTIIISNPNGMLMTAGGSINTLGALILTTQDMYNKEATFTDDGKLNINGLLTNSAFKDNAYSVISLNAGNITGADINIIAKGINVINGSDITSSGNISFTTSDGANFIANHNGATLPSGYSINIANSSLKAKDGTGTITLKAGDMNTANDAGNVRIQNSTFTAKDTKITGNDVKINSTAKGNIIGDSTVVNGNLDINSAREIRLYNTTVKGNTTTNNEYCQRIYKLTTNNLTANAGYELKIGYSDIKNDVKAVAGTNQDGNFEGRDDSDAYYKMFFMKDTNVGGNLDASSETGYIHLDGGSVVGNAILAGNTSGKGEMGHIIIGYTTGDKAGIWANPERCENSTIIGGTITATAKDGTGKYFPTFADGNLIAYSEGDLTFKGGSVDQDAMIKSDGKVFVNYGNDGIMKTSTTVGGNLDINAGNEVRLYNSTVDGDTTVNTEYCQRIYKLTTNNLTANAGYELKIGYSDIKNDVKAVAGTNQDGNFEGRDDSDAYYKMFFMKDTNVGGNLDASSETGYIHLDGGSVVGNAILAGNTSGKGEMGHIIIGYTTGDKAGIWANPERCENSTIIGGTITATAKDGTGKYFPEFADGNLIAYSKENLTFKGGSADQDAMITSDKDISFNIDANGPFGTSTTIGGDFTANAGMNVTVTDIDVKGKAVMNAKTGDVTTTASKYGSTADLKAGHDVNFILNDIEGKLDAEAGHDVNYVTKGDINLNETQSAKLAIRAGNTAHIKTIDGNITVDSIKADTEVMKGKNIHLTADNDITFVGDNVINGNLIATSTSGNGFVAINGNSTKADNITVDKAKWVEIKNVETGHLNLSNFIIGHLIQSTFDSTEASNCSDTLYVHRLNTKVNGYDVVEDAITPTVAESVNNLIYYPYFPEEEPTDPVDPNYTDSNDAARILGYMREQGIDGTLGKDYAPIGFAAYDRAKRGTIYRAAGDAIYKDISQTVHVTKRFDLD